MRFAASLSQVASPALDSTVIPSNGLQNACGAMYSRAAVVTSDTANEDEVPNCVRNFGGCARQIA